MSEIKENKNKKKKRSLLGLLFLGCLPKAFMVLLLFVITLLISINFLPKTKFFQDFAGKQVTDILKDQLKAETKIGSIYFGRLGYLEINQVFMFAAGDTVAYIPKVIVDVDIWRYFDGEIEINQLSLENPHIKMIRSMDSTWNVTHIAKASEEDSSSSSNIPFIDIDDFKINNGTFLLYDSLKVKQEDHEPSKLLNYSFLQLKDLNIDLSGGIDLNDKEMDFDIENISFLESRTGLLANHIEFDDLSFDDNSIKYDDLVLVLNGEKVESNDLNLSNFSVLNPDKIDISKANLEIEFRSENFNIRNIDHFTDGVKILNGSYGFMFEAEGPMQDLVIKRMDFSGEEIESEFSGKVINMFSPEINYKLSSDFVVTNNKFISDLLSVINKRDLPNYRKYKINNLEIDGGIRSSKFDISLMADNTLLESKGNLNFQTFDYKANVNTRNFNIAKILKNEIKSNINANIDLSGKGFDIFKDSLNLKFRATKSSFNDIKLDNFYSAISAKEGLFNIDSLIIGNVEKKLELKGNIDISDINEPFYFVTINAKDFDSDFLADGLPTNLNGELIINGRGFDPENMDLNLGANFSGFKINEFNFEDVIISSKLLSDTNGSKQITLSSDFLDLQSSGTYSYPNLAKIIDVQTEIFQNKINLINGIVLDTLKNDTLFQEKYILPKTNLKLEANLKDISRFEKFFEGYNLKTKGELALEMESDSSDFFLNVYKLDFLETNLNIENDTLHADDLNLNMIVIEDLREVEPRFTELSLNLKSPNIKYAENNLDSTKINFTIKDKTLNVDLGTTYNNEFIFGINGDLTRENEELNFNFDDFLFGYVDLVNYRNVGNFTGKIKNGNVIIDSLTIRDKNEETIGLIGEYNFLDNKFKDLELNFENYSFENLVQITTENTALDFLRGKVSILSLRLNGDFENPLIDIVADGQRIEYNGIDLGRISSEIHYQDKVIFGDLYLFNPEKGTNFSVNINTLPIDLRLIEVEDRFSSTDSAEIYVDISNFPAQVAEPFVPGLKNFRGALNGGIRITGDISDHLIYNGNINTKNTSFLVEATNLEYIADADVSISNDYINIEKFILKNRKQDLKKGRAEVTGYMHMDNFNPDDFEFTIRSNEIKVLREETKYTMPTIYGDFIIGTGKRPLVFSGNFKESDLTGDIIVKKGNLKMTADGEPQLISSKLTYVFKDSLLYLNSKEKEITIKKNESEFADLINYDLYIDFENDMRFEYDVNAFLKLKALINAENLYYRQDRNEDEPQIIGEILVVEPSRVSVFGLPQNFITSGEVSFPTGKVTNPTFDLVAKYENTDRKGIRYQLRILITGDLEEPKINYELTYDGQEFSGEQAQKDFYSLIGSNSRAQDLGDLGNGEGGLENTGIDITNSLISDAISKNITKALGLDANVNLDLNDPNNSTVEFGGEIFRGIRWTLGGSPANPENNEISVVVPLRVVIPYSMLDNLIIELSKPNNPYATRENQKQWEINLNYHGKW